MFNYPGSPDPKIWAMKKDLDAAFAKIGSLEEKLNAVAKDVTFKIQFNNNGGTGTMSQVTMTGLGSVVLPECTMEKEGYEFVSWNTESDGSGRSYSDESTVTWKDFASVSGNVHLYAQWG